jgi:hypothetical protein
VLREQNHATTCCNVVEYAHEYDHPFDGSKSLDESIDDRSKAWKGASNPEHTEKVKKAEDNKKFD